MMTPYQSILKNANDVLMPEAHAGIIRCFIPRSKVTAAEKTARICRSNTVITRMSQSREPKPRAKRGGKRGGKGGDPFRMVTGTAFFRTETAFFRRPFRELMFYCKIEARWYTL